MIGRSWLRGLALAALGTFATATAVAAGCATSPPCQRNSDCLQGYCDNGDCKVGCVDSTLDCPKGYHCNIVSQCEPDDGAGGSTSVSTTDTSTQSSTSTSAPSSSTGPSTTTTSTGMGGLHEFDPCAADADCASPLICRSLTVGANPKRCTRSCSSNGDCMTGTRCETVAGTTFCAGDDTGRQCAGASACNFGCLLGPKYCTSACGTGADCPNGYGCMPVGNPPQSVCVKAEAPCSAQDPSACIAPSACDEALPLIVSGCTLVCNSAADCPQRAAGLSPWTCLGGLCKRPPDVYGPLEGGATPAQYACDANSQPVNVCNDGQHIDFATFSIPNPPVVNCNSPMTTSGVPGDSCLDSCRYQGGCRYGFACAALATIGAERIGLCMPSGSGEVGTGCSNDTQCVFGYCRNGKCTRDCTRDGVCPSGEACVAAGGPSVEGLPFKRCQ